MVDPIGIKAGTVDRRAAPVAATEPVAAAKSATVKEQAAQAPSATLISKAMATAAPVDAERVARIRRAVQEGRFPLVPSTIADRLLALRMDWNPNDKA